MYMLGLTFSKSELEDATERLLNLEFYTTLLGNKSYL